MSDILIIDNEPGILFTLKSILENEGYNISTARNGLSGFNLIKEGNYQLVISDLKMPVMDGDGLLKLFNEKEIKIPLIIMTAFGTIDNAVKLVKKGAFDFIKKPFEPSDIINKTRKALEYYKRINIDYVFKERIFDKYSLDSFIGQHEHLRKIYDAVLQVAPTKATVMITGESGTGKELIAKAIHKYSKRKDEPLITINCGALNDNLLESEMFGYEKGAFTGADRQRQGKFETADRGTIFLDEIGDMSKALQVKLLRVLQESTFERLGSNETIHVDVRIIGATNTEIEKLVSEGNLREDLYYRLNVFNIYIPPLRKRREDIPILCYNFVKIYSEELEKKIDIIDDSVIDMLINYDFPGNVRELENLIYRACILCRSNVITKDHLPDKFLVQERNVFGSVINSIPTNYTLNEIKDNIERELIKKKLIEAKGIQSKAAKLLGISRSDINYKIKKHGL